MSSDDSELDRLRRQLSEAEETIEALVSGELDSVATAEGASPVLLVAAQDELRKSQRRFAAIFENSSDAILLCDGDGRHLDANRAACELLATSREELLGKSGGLFMADPERRRALVQSGHLDGTIDVATHDGGTRTVEYRAVGNILPGLHLTIFRDVTDELAAQTAQARLAAIVKSSADAIVGLTGDGVIVDWNPAAERLYGYRAAEALGRVPAFLEGPEQQGEWPQLWKQLMRGEQVSELETVRRRKDGADVEVSLTMSPIWDGTGTVIGYSEIARDITDHKQAERRFKAILESAPDAIVAVDRAGTIVLVNGRVEQVFGYKRGELLGQSVHILLPEGLRAIHEDHRENYVRAPVLRLRTKGRELHARRKDGTTFAVEITLSPVEHGPDGPLVIAAVRDVTDRNEMRDQLIISDRMVSIGTLAAGVAHEINNPLSAVTANLDLALNEVAVLAKGLDGLEELADELRDAREAAERVRLIVRDLKIFSRLEEERLQPVDVQRIMDSTLRMAWNEIRHRARLVKDYGIVPEVRASDSRLGQVFLNIIVNAAQAIPEGRANANVIRVSSAVEASGLVVVTISDTGPGMPPEVLERLFTPFFTTKPVGVGSGLGLSICQRLVTNFGGHISVESKIGQGTAFRIFLVPAAPKEAPQEAPRPAPSEIARRRVLVVDDEKMIGRAVRRTLGPEHDVTALTSAREALQRVVAGERFDVILCDLMMPQMTGMELHAELLRIAPDQAGRMIFITGGAFTPLARDFLEQTAHPRLEKPFDLQQLRALVNDRFR